MTHPRPKPVCQIRKVGWPSKRPWLVFVRDFRGYRPFSEFPTWEAAMLFASRFAPATD